MPILNEYSTISEHSHEPTSPERGRSQRLGSQRSARLGLPQPRPAGTRKGTRLPQPLADRRTCLRRAQSRRLSDHGRGRRARAHRARQGRRGARLPQSLPPPRQPGRRRQPGQLQERACLPVPRLGLQSRRHAARRRPAALIPRSRQERVRPDAARPRSLDGLHLHPLPQGAAALRRRTDEAGRGRDRALSCRGHGSVLGHLDPEVAGQLEVGARRRQ